MAKCLHTCGREWAGRDSLQVKSISRHQPSASNGQIDESEEENPLVLWITTESNQRPARQ